MNQDTYIFPCVFIYSDAGISIYFPDLDGCVSYGDNDSNAFHNAKEALTLHLFGMEQDEDGFIKKISPISPRMDKANNVYAICFFNVDCGIQQIIFRSFSSIYIVHQSFTAFLMSLKAFENGRIFPILSSSRPCSRRWYISSFPLSCS